MARTASFPIHVELTKRDLASILFALKSRRQRIEIDAGEVKRPCDTELLYHLALLEEKINAAKHKNYTIPTNAQLSELQDLVKYCVENTLRKPLEDYLKRNNIEFKIK